MPEELDTSRELRAYVLGPGEGARSRNPTSVVVFKLRGGECADTTNVFEIEVPSGNGPPLHFHEAQDEWLYVLDGEFRFRLDDEVTPAPPGRFLPLHVPHARQSVGQRPGRLIGAFVPPALERFFERFSTVHEDEATADVFRALAHDEGMIVVGPALAQSHPL